MRYTEWESCNKLIQLLKERLDSFLYDEHGKVVSHNLFVERVKAKLHKEWKVEFRQKKGETQFRIIRK